MSVGLHQCVGICLVSCSGATLQSSTEQGPIHCMCSTAMMSYAQSFGSQHALRECHFQLGFWCTTSAQTAAQAIERCDDGGCEAYLLGCLHPRVNICTLILSTSRRLVLHVRSVLRTMASLRLQSSLSQWQFPLERAIDLSLLVIKQGGSTFSQ